MCKVKDSLISKRRFRACKNCSSSKLKCVTHAEGACCERCAERSLTCEYPQYNLQKRFKEHTIFNEEKSEKRLKLLHLLASKGDAPFPNDASFLVPENEPSDQQVYVHTQPESASPWLFESEQILAPGNLYDEGVGLDYLEPKVSQVSQVPMGQAMVKKEQSPVSIGAAPGVDLEPIYLTETSFIDKVPFFSEIGLTSNTVANKRTTKQNQELEVWTLKREPSSTNVADMLPSAELRPTPFNILKGTSPLNMRVQQALANPLNVLQHCTRQSQGPMNGVAEEKRSLPILPKLKPGSPSASSPPSNQSVNCGSPTNFMGSVATATQGKLSWAGKTGADFLEAFIDRYSSLPFLFDAESLRTAILNCTEMVDWENKLWTSFCQESHYVNRIEQTAFQTSVIVACALGAHQLKLLNGTFKTNITVVVGRAAQVLQECDQSSTMVLRAMGLVATYYFIMCSPTHMSAILESFTMKLSSTHANYRLPVCISIKISHHFISLLLLFRECQVEAERYLWGKLVDAISKNLEINVSKTFPQVSKIMEEEYAAATTSLGPHHKIWIDDTLEVFRHDSGAVKALAVFLLSVEVSPVILKVLSRLDTDVHHKVSALEEVLGFFRSSVEAYGLTMAPSFQCTTIQFYSNLIKLFQALLLQKDQTAAEFLMLLTSQLCKDPLFVSVFWFLPDKAHLLHLLCLAFSMLGMVDEYDKFQRELYEIASMSGVAVPPLPASFPISCHGLCEDPKCLASWNGLLDIGLQYFFDYAENLEIGLPEVEL